MSILTTTEENVAAVLRRYPQAAGHKTGDTSQAAAKVITKTGRAQQLRDKIMALLSKADCTADEAAKTLNESQFSIRPRFSELRKMDKIEKTGTTRRNESNSPAIVWKKKDPQQTFAI